MTDTNNREFLETFGFLSKEARMNLVVFFIVLLTTSNIFFIYRAIHLESQLSKANEDKFRLSLELNQKITDEVRKQIQPTTQRINRVVERIDSVATRANNKLETLNTTE